MKKKMLSLILLMITMSVIVRVTIKMIQPKEEAKNTEQIKVVTSFYPMYIMTKNLVKDMPGVELINLGGDDDGCPHDYQLTTTDMKLLADADIFIMNGGGMEGYIEEVVKNNGNLIVIDSSTGLDIEENPHIWMDPAMHQIQISNVQDELSKYLEELSINSKELKILYSNTDIYLEKVKELDLQLTPLIEGMPIITDGKNEAVLFHDAFEYLAKRANIDIAYIVELEDDTSLSAGEIGDIIDYIRVNDIKLLFSEEQFEENIPQRIADETDATVYIIDSAVAGDNSVDSYINAMKKNIKVIKKALNDSNNN